MSSDWGWYFTSAERRTTMLRDELDAVSAIASSQNVRLSSQLRTLQGSIETRLNALSAAFDAYVELGDIREQLAGFPDTTVIRRDVAAAVDALAQGRAAERVDDRGQTYWLPHAANAVIGVVAGKPDAEEESTARSLSPQADLFVVAACGALGHGEAVADRVPGLLTCDTGLSPDQLALWAGVIDGRFGSGGLPAVRAVWSPALDEANADVPSWRTWIHDQAKTPDVETMLDWVARLLGVGSEPLPAAAPAGNASGSAAGHAPEPTNAGSVAALRGVVTGLVAQGTDQEGPLLARARELRERIENPGRASGQDTVDQPGTPVIDVVRRSVLGTAPESAERDELVSWITPGIRSAAEAEAATLATEAPISEQIRTPEGTIEVGATGPEPGQVERARAGIQARYPTSPMVSGLFGGAAGVLLVVTIVLFAIGSGWAFLTLVLAIAGGVAAVRAELQRRGRITTAAEAASRLDEGLAGAQRRVEARLDAREITRTKAGSALEAIRAADQVRPGNPGRT
jgi:hypothetical protein